MNRYVTDEYLNLLESLKVSINLGEKRGYDLDVLRLQRRIYITLRDFTLKNRQAFLSAIVASDEEKYSLVSEKLGKVKALDEAVDILMKVK